MEYELFGWAAKRYDLHTPPAHYHNDHRFVLEELRDLPSGSRLLDVGCGTGVFLEKASAAGFEVFGIDVAAPMVEVARARLGRRHVDIRAMQALDEVGKFDALVSLCWSFNYCSSLAEAGVVLGRFARALRPGGTMLLQVAHAPAATGELMEDREPGPKGEEDDVLFLYRFTEEGENEPTLRAEYVYACRSLNELLCETHRLHAADVLRLADLATNVGFEVVAIYDSWKRRPLDRSLSPFLVAKRAG